MIDTLTIRSGGGGAQIGEQSEESPDTQGAAYMQTSAAAQQAQVELLGREPQEMTYKSVRKTKSKGRTPNPFSKTEGGWEAAKAVMG